MIIRERTDAFIMIEQHQHATISGKLFDQVKPNFALTNDIFHDAVRTAIYQHDVGWIPFDTTPFWDDKEMAPYSFITYPNSIKTVLYKDGIDQVTNVDPYAGLLCSEHYIRFLAKDEATLSQQFIEAERIRQTNIISSLTHYEENSFATHYELIQFFDNLSLYLCLHEPGTSEEDIHYFFKRGIPLPKIYGGGRLNLAWDRTHLLLDKPLFIAPINVLLPHKVVMKEQINEVGLADAWKRAPIEIVQLTVTNETI